MDQSSQLTKKFPAFYGTRRFFTVLTSAGTWLYIKKYYQTRLTYEFKKTPTIAQPTQCFNF
jgi:hypothetical protein